jgi:hypothetical protein
MSITRREALKSLVLGSGIVLSSASVLSVLNSAYAASSKDNFSPRFFSHEQAQSLALITHVIIPTSESLPGAEDVPIVPFIDALYTQLMSKDDRAKFVAGFDVAMKQFNSKYNADFIAASNAQRQAFINDVYNQPKDKTQQILNMINATTAPDGQEDYYLLYSFLFNLRALTLEGYFKSELVGEKVLAYLPIPGPFEADITIDENTRAWSI